MLKEFLKIYIKEVFTKYKALAKIISDKNRKFILKF
jgi:hypothetical protein